MAPYAEFEVEPHAEFEVGPDAVFEVGPDAEFEVRPDAEFEVGRYAEFEAGPYRIGGELLSCSGLEAPLLPISVLFSLLETLGVPLENVFFN